MATTNSKKQYPGMLKIIKNCFKILNYSIEILDKIKIIFIIIQNTKQYY
jgi:hypothetical protein